MFNIYTFLTYFNFTRSSLGEKNYLQEELDVSGFRYAVYSLTCFRQLCKLLCINVLAIGKREVASLLILKSSACVLEREARENKVKKVEAI